MSESPLSNGYKRREFRHERGEEYSVEGIRVIREPGKTNSAGTGEYLLVLPVAWEQRANISSAIRSEYESNMEPFNGHPAIRIYAPSSANARYRAGEIARMLANDAVIYSPPSPEITHTLAQNGIAPASLSGDNVEMKEAGPARPDQSVEREESSELAKKYKYLRLEHDTRNGAYFLWIDEKAESVLGTNPQLRQDLVDALDGKDHLVKVDDPKTFRLFYIRAGEDLGDEEAQALAEKINGIIEGHIENEGDEGEISNSEPWKETVGRVSAAEHLAESEGGTDRFVITFPRRGVSADHIRRIRALSSEAGGEMSEADGDIWRITLSAVGERNSDERQNQQQEVNRLIQSIHGIIGEEVEEKPTDSGLGLSFVETKDKDDEVPEPKLDEGTEDEGDIKERLAKAERIIETQGRNLHTTQRELAEAKAEIETQKRAIAEETRFREEAEGKAREAMEALTGRVTALEARKDALPEDKKSFVEKFASIYSKIPWYAKVGVGVALSLGAVTPGIGPACILGILAMGTAGGIAGGIGAKQRTKELLEWKREEGKKDSTGKYAKYASWRDEDIANRAKTWGWIVGVGLGALGTMRAWLPLLEEGGISHAFASQTPGDLSHMPASEVAAVKANFAAETASFKADMAPYLHNAQLHGVVVDGNHHMQLAQTAFDHGNLTEAHHQMHLAWADVDKLQISDLNADIHGLDNQLDRFALLFDHPDPNVHFAMTDASDAFEDAQYMLAHGDIDGAREAMSYAHGAFEEAQRQAMYDMCHGGPHFINVADAGPMIHGHMDAWMSYSNTYSDMFQVVPHGQPGLDGFMHTAMLNNPDSIFADTIGPLNHAQSEQMIGAIRDTMARNPDMLPLLVSDAHMRAGDIVVQANVSAWHPGEAFANADFQRELAATINSKYHVLAHHLGNVHGAVRSIGNAYMSAAHIA